MIAQKFLSTFLVVYAKLVSGLLEPLILSLFAWLHRYGNSFREPD
jgi:hypothetical protein